MSKSNKSDTIKKNLLEALIKSLGVVTTACRSVDISRKTFYKYYNEDEVFKTDVDDINNIALDFAESSLHKKIKEGCTTSTIFYLKTKGKKRGYIEKQQHEHSGEVGVKKYSEIIRKVDE